MKQLEGIVQQVDKGYPHSTHYRLQSGEHILYTLGSYVQIFIRCWFPVTTITATATYT